MAEEGKRRIIEMPEATSIGIGDYFAIDSESGGAKKLPQSALPSKAETESEIGRLNDISYGVANYTMPISWFERGSITNGNNDSYREGSRARNKTIISFDTITAITVTTGQFGVTYYNDNGTYNRWGGWKTNADTVVLPKGQKFRVMFSLNNSAPASRVDALVDMVSILRFYTDKNQPHVLTPYDMPFEHGTIERGQNNDYNGAARIRNAEIMQYPYSLKVSMKTGTYLIHFYHDDDSFAYATSWRTTEAYIIPPSTKFRMVLTTTASASAYTMIETLIDALEISPIPNSDNFDPNIVYQCRNVDDTIYPPYSKWYIQAAAQNQYDRVRFNVRKTTDGYYFLCHDTTINNVARNTDGSEISSSVPSYGRTLAELNSYDWGIKYGAYYAGAKVPMLEDALLYSAMYNLGVSVEFSSLVGWTDDDTNNVLTMFDKYGVTDNLIVIDPDGMNFTFLKKFIAHNERISCYVAGPEANFTASAIASTDELKTNYNKVYVQLYPWGTAPTDTFIALAKQHGWVLYNSFLISKSALLQIDNFQKGYGLIEAANVFAIKDTLKVWADSLIDG